MQALAAASPQQNGGDLQQRLKQLTTNAPVMLFIKVTSCAALLLQLCPTLLPSSLKRICQYSTQPSRMPSVPDMQGSRQQPFCRFSKAAVAAVEKTGVPFETFDIFTVGSN